MKPLRLNKPYMIVMIGLPGAGKSFFATKFSEMFSAPYMHYPAYNQFFDNAETRDIIIQDTMEKLLMTGHAIVVEGPGQLKSERDQLTKLAEKYSYQILFVWVQTDPVVSQKRAAKKQNGGLSRQDFEDAIERFQPFAKNEPYLVISGKHTYQTQIRTVLRKIATEERQTTPTTTPPPASNDRRVFLRGRTER